MTYAQIVSEFKNKPRDVSTSPISNVQPKYFHVTSVDGSIYISNAISHQHSSRIRTDRKLNENEYEPMLNLYHRRQAGEKVSQEAIRITINSVYWYGIFAELKL